MSAHLYPTTLALNINWADQGTSDGYESLLVEVIDRLHDAPNVENYWTITDNMCENAIGFAINFRASREMPARREFFLALEAPELIFDGAGNVTVIHS